MKKLLLSSTLLLACLLNLTPASAQKVKIKQKAGASTLSDAARRTLALFGGVSATEAERLAGPAIMADATRSFASRTEASRFFSEKGFEYLAENQPDTAMYRFNLAWALDPRNPDALRGQAVVLSQRNVPPTEIMPLVQQGLVLAPNNAALLGDLGTLQLLQYSISKKKRDLTEAVATLEHATQLQPTNGAAWNQLAHAYYSQEKYAEAWQAVHATQKANMALVDFNLVSELMSKLPDPQGTFK
ncbi:hypothetical protein FY528_03595 [Hymenobacter lutimineralis]|uniref:Uncharacterized protein n=1 Tax=Hymenobacter lutimineralis TaxID=2606448 RepID=A0A5D6VDT1_9BACT|nr:MULTISPECIES: tetratricopeptide repeat protein [Hymenobacter]QIX61290.1 hypothetical protein HER32_08890 [Hymenobacter sp. BT18]TYZ13505.1 hypothetical protein FY528_03595 [Hymenobacter lutimineralis]